MVSNSPKSIAVHADCEPTEFNTGLRIAYWLNVPSLVCITLILITFAVLPSRLSHSHYLSVGLCVSLIILDLSFIVPLGTRPDMCFNDITPRDQYSSLSCAWSGALFIAGTLLATVWILLRSVWIHLQLCWGVHNVSKLYWPIQVLGWGLPALFLALTMPITGVSYRLGTTCLPNQKNSYVTYLGWVMAFAGISGLLQLYTTAYCAWIYLRDVFRRGSAPLSTKASGYSGGGSKATGDNATTSTQSTAKVTWSRLKRIIKTQWRSVGLSILLIVNSMFYGGIFTQQARLENRIANGKHNDHIIDWATCIVLGGLDPDKCRGIPKVINEKSFLASFAMAGCIGMACSLLLVRKSMLQGWMFILRHRRLPPREDDGAFIIARPRSAAARRNAEKNSMAVSSATPHRSEEHEMRSPGEGMQSPIGTMYTAKEGRRLSETSSV